MGVRYYNQATGAFTSLDPVPGGNATTYNYPTDPINQFDLDGKRKCSKKKTRLGRAGCRLWGGYGNVQYRVVSYGARKAAKLNGMSCRKVGSMTSCTGGRFRLNGGGGTTYGNVYLSGGRHLTNGSRLYGHEYAHSRQWKRPFFAVRYAAASAYSYVRTGNYHCKNRYEKQANLRAGGYGTTYKSWWGRGSKVKTC